MRGGGAQIGALAVLVVTGVIIANILIHPTGTQAAANAVTTIAKPSYNALLGVPS